ncbi:hypothetical protein TNCT_191761 [Trichonephila clavata]|uniref:Uncharacterized protein n=1 Tax=Trichonephila clavata TaxID=2740835 RepID=A0A8X6HMY4_TRICU|nr:hypothetical protein TNCT_191761 [Trichonephila clavata]
MLTDRCGHYNRLCLTRTVGVEDVVANNIFELEERDTAMHTKEEGKNTTTIKSRNAMLGLLINFRRVVHDDIPTQCWVGLHDELVAIVSKSIGFAHFEFFSEIALH